MQRYKLTIAYRGTRYHGWQRQAANAFFKGPSPENGEGIPTIQETLSRSIVSVVRHPVELVGSSRTDAGVHAKGQLAHFDTDQLQIPPEGLRRAINAHLPEDIVVRRLEPVDPRWHAIGSTLSKRYQYFVWNAPDRPVFFPDLAFHRWQRLDLPAMRQAAAHLVGTHDFATFARPGHGRENTVRTVLACDVARLGPRLVVAVEGTGFLWNMVRIIAGTLVEVGLGRFNADDVAQMLLARDRRTAGSTAPAHGLFLHWIKSVEAGPANRASGAVSDRSETAAAIRPSHVSDLPQLMDIAKSLPSVFDGPALRAMQIDLAYQAGHKAVVGGEAVGFATYIVIGGAGALGWIAVRPEWQQRGIGRRLVEQIISDLRRRDADALRVHLPQKLAQATAAKFFFERTGFSPRGRAASPPESVEMARAL